MTPVTVIVKHTLLGPDREYKPGETCVLDAAEAQFLAHEGVVDIMRGRTPGMRDKMIYTEQVMHHGSIRR